MDGFISKMIKANPQDSNCHQLKIGMNPPKEA